MARGPDSAMARGIAILIFLVLGLCIAAGMGAGWLLTRWLSPPTAWTIGLLLPAAVFCTFVAWVFPEMIRSYLAPLRAARFHFKVPADLKGRIYLVSDSGGANVVRSGRDFAFEIPASRVLRVKPFTKLDDPWATFTATRPDGSSVPVQWDGREMANGVIFRAFYLGTFEERASDPTSFASIADQVRELS